MGPEHSACCPSTASRISRPQPRASAMSRLSQLPGWLLALIVVGSIPALAAPVNRCPTGRAPTGSDVGVNGNEGQSPLFRLEVKGTSLGFAPSQTYTVSLAAGLEFSDASVKLSTSGSCGAGALRYLHEDFSPASGCRHFLSTSRKQAMSALPPLQWTAPQCGCVTFSVTVRKNAVFYQDGDGISDGFLTRTICQDTRENRLQLLCQAAERFTGAYVMERPYFLKRHGIEPASLSALSLERLELALEQRRADLQECCRLSGALTDECFADIRRRRIDRFCGDGYPGIPFTKSRSEFMVMREADCCWRLGLARYQCFAKDAQGDGTTKMANQLDYSLDETDPANDLGDYPTELGVVQQETRSDGLRDSEGVTPAPLARNDVINTAKPTIRPTTTTTLMPRTRQLDSMEVDVADAGRGKGEGAPAPRVSKDEGVVNPSWQRTFDHRASKNLSPLPKKADDLMEAALGGSSSVEETMNGWRQKFYRIQLKLRCCEEGQKSGEYFRGKGEELAWSRCPRGAKVALEMTRGSQNRRTCRNNFLRCCVEEARTPTTAAMWAVSDTPAPPASRQRDSREEVAPEFSPFLRRPSPQPQSPPANPKDRAQYDVKEDDDTDDVYGSEDDNTDLVDDKTDTMTSERPAQADVRGDKMASVEMREKTGRGQSGRGRGVVSRKSSRAALVSVLDNPSGHGFPDEVTGDSVVTPKEGGSVDSGDSDDVDSFTEDDNEEEEFLNVGDDIDDDTSDSNPNENDDNDDVDGQGDLATEKNDDVDGQGDLATEKNDDVDGQDDLATEKNDDVDGQDDLATEKKDDDSTDNDHSDDLEAKSDHSSLRALQKGEQKVKKDADDNDDENDNDSDDDKKTDVTPARTEENVQSGHVTSTDSSTENTRQRSSRRHNRRQRNGSRRHNKRQRHRRKKASP